MHPTCFAPWWQPQPVKNPMRNLERIGGEIESCRKWYRWQKLHEGEHVLGDQGWGAEWHQSGLGHSGRYAASQVQQFLTQQG